MNRLLDILVPMYNEDETSYKYLFDSLAIQQSIDFEKIGVIVCCDGGKAEITEEFKNKYPFYIEFNKCKHKGVSATRNKCLEHSDAEYVMFCDADDMFCNVCGLWIIFREIKNKKFDAFISVFTEQTKIRKDKEFGEDFIFTNHFSDSTFVHGKVYRKEYLINNKIRFNDKLTIHEDSYFNILAQNCTKEIIYCQNPFYLWKWRDESVCRHDPKYILKTYNNMLDSNDALITEFLKRGMADKASFYVIFMIYDAYYSLNKPEWLDINNKEYRDNVEKRFTTYYLKHKKVWNDYPPTDKVFFSNGIRERAIKEGMLMEGITIDNWLKKIVKKYKK